MGLNNIQGNNSSGCLLNTYLALELLTEDRMEILVLWFTVPFSIQHLKIIVYVKNANFSHTCSLGAAKHAAAGSVI